MTKRYVYTFGAKSYGDQFRKEAADMGITAVHIIDERPDKPSYAKTVEQIMADFETQYDPESSVLGFVSFGRASVIGGLEHTAKAWELLHAKHAGLKATKFIGPSYAAARKFFNKKRMSKLFVEYGIDIPATKDLTGRLADELIVELKAEKFPFPALIKTTELAGGRGMALVRSLDDFTATFEELKGLGLTEFILSEYIDGLEVSFAAVRLDDTFLRLPPCYKEETYTDLTHPDSKVKLTGVFKYFDDIYEKLERIMQQEKITGFIFIEAILQRTSEGGYSLKFIEGATRLGGNSVLEFASLEGFSLHHALLEWLTTGNVDFPFGEKNLLCVQHATFTHHGQEDVEKLLAKPWVLEAKLEDLGSMPFSTDKRTRIRISFVGPDMPTASQRLQEIGGIVGNSDYAPHVNGIFKMYQQRYPELCL
jgi:hypothetical protein